MSARTCQLCGKTLSRFAGTGEDFCSREHRNQYRLRRGMDRLLEANKVASVMRRRESPRQIPAERLRSSGPVLPRGFMARGWDAPAAPGWTPRSLAADKGKAGLAANVGLLPPPPANGVGGQRGMMQPGFTPGSPLAPPLVAPLAAQVKQAAAVAPRRAMADSRANRRPAVLVWRAMSEPVTGELARRAAQQPATHPIESSPAARSIAQPSRGRALMVSMAAGFQIPESKLRSIRFGGPGIAGMRWPEFRESGRQPAAGAGAAQVAAIVSPPPSMRVPAAPSFGSAIRFTWPGAHPIAIHFVDADIRPRTAAVPFGNPEESIAKERR